MLPRGGGKRSKSGKNDGNMDKEQRTREKSYGPPSMVN